MQKVHHVGIAVNNLEASLRVYEVFLKDLQIHREEVPKQKVRVASIELGDSHLELLQPTALDSPIAKFIEKKGTGIHHICIQVDDIEESLAALKDSGYELIDNEPKDGAMGMKVAFVHPKSTTGVLLELAQMKE